MKVREILREVNIDNVNGAGAVPYNRGVDYFGFKVAMKPSQFLKLALPIERGEATSADGLKQYLSKGGAIGSPWFDIEIPQQWEDGDFSVPASIKGHEGRNRMIAIQELEGDVPVEVHFFLRGGYRARDIKPEWIQSFSQAIKAERSNNVVHRPFEKVLG